VRLPRRVRVLGRWYGIARAETIQHPDKPGKEADALCVLDRHAILIRSGLRLEDAREALWHEIKHIIVEVLDINPKTEKGHRIASVIEDSVMADNPSLARLYGRERPDA